MGRRIQQSVCSMGLLLVVMVCMAGGEIIYVDADACGNNDGGGLLQVVGQLKSGQCFYGADTARMIGQQWQVWPRRRL